uniref:Peptidase S1 domain-containing protein n=1 Tax=Gopherus agassizii TaxID=38772 RepID=A0A452H416_9SAUR
MGCQQLVAGRVAPGGHRKGSLLLGEGGSGATGTLWITLKSVTVLVGVGMTQARSHISGKQLVSGRIFNGQDAKAGAWPWQVSVQLNSLHICGGSLISESWVVSAAHCFDSSVANSSYRVQLGENQIFGQSRLHSFALVKRIILHPSYDDVTHQADIALVELKNPIAFTATISPVGLLDASVHVPAGDTCWVTGWGREEYEKDPAPNEGYRLGEGSVICTQTDSLQKPEGDNPIKEDMMCAGPKEGYKGFGPGDGGGPLVCKKDGTWYLAGIASWCLTRTVNGVTSIAPGYPGVYNRLNSHNDWIKANVPDVTFIPDSATPTRTGPSATILRVFLLTQPADPAN